MQSNEDISILVLYTGGTIGMMKDRKTGALVPFDFDNIYAHLPVLKNFGYQIDIYSFDPLIDSSNMSPDFWVLLAKKIGEEYEHYDGFVVLHGSDTMAYTASALSFMLENLNKPVVLTGSQLPMGMVRSDGRENFLAAVEIAAAKDDDTSIVPEVYRPRSVYLLSEPAAAWQPCHQVQRRELQRLHLVELSQSG